MRIFLLSLLCSLLLISITLGQSQIASPQIINYNSEQYLAGVQNWDIAQDNNGILYFGNNEGLVTFNGKYWKTYPLPNLTVIRSVKIDSKNRIFVGGQDEAGYFFPDKNGVLKYHSLVPLIAKKDQKFADVWNICIVNDEVFFRTKNIILQYKEDAIRSYKPAISWEFMGEANNRLFAHSFGKGLMIYDKDVWKPYFDDPILKETAITSILDYSKDTLLVSTLKNGLFLLHNNKLIKKPTSLDNIFINHRIYTAIKVNKDWFAIGTTSGGLFIMNKAGRFIQKYSHQEGLQNNNIRGLLIDQTKNLWLALDDGIDFIAINSAVKNIYPDKDKQVTSYAFNVFNQYLYFGTSNGLYSSIIEPGATDLSLSKDTFFEVKNSKGQVWNLEEVNNQLLMGHEDGAYVIKKNIAQSIYKQPGTWLFQPVSNVFPSEQIIAGTYWGLQNINFKNGTFSNADPIPGIKEALRFVIFDNNNSLWASHPYRGVFKIDLTEGNKKVKNVTIFTQKQGLPTSLYNYVYKIKNRIVVATEKGVYEYDETLNKFKVFPLLSEALKNISLQYLKEDGNGNIWYVSNKNLGVVDFNRPNGRSPYTIVNFPQLNGKVVGGFECVYPYDNENIFIGANKGAYHINYKKYAEEIANPKVVLGLVRLFGKKDSILYGGYFLNNNNEVSSAQDPESIIKLPYYLNSINFEYSSTLFEHQKNLEFSYQLQGFDKSWSPWITKTEKDYTNLSPGKYIFNVKVRNSESNESEAIIYSFIVLPAWYQNLWMYCFYLMLLGVIVYIFLKWQQKKHQVAHERLSYLHQLELDRNEKQIVKLQNEKLESDVEFKNRELSTMTLHLVQRGEVLAKIKEVISTVIKNHDINDSSPSFRHLVRSIRDVEKSDEDWDQFTMHFNNVNTDFFNKLKDKYTDLTPNELKLCAYLKMNLSTKEIAQLINITIKAVEVGRYRLRKKLQLQPETNLYEFLTKVSRTDR